jgi:hypothetical protein
VVDVPLHPFIFAGYAVLALLAHNIQEVPIRDSLRSFAFALLLAGLALSLLWLATHSAAKAGLIASIVIITFFTYGHLYDLLRGATIGSFLVGRHRFLAPTMLVGVLAVGTAIARAPRLPTFTNRFLNLMAAVAVLLALYPIATYARASILQGQNPWDGGLQTVRLNPSADSPRPDIYYIILDGYARSDYMASEFGFDNSGFMDFLEQRGFVVAEESRPNYLWTALSLASSLNMEYVQNLGLPLVEGSYPSVFVEPIRHNRVRSALENAGYSTISLSSSWTATELIDADIYLALESIESEALADPTAGATTLTPFESQLLFTTPLRLIVPRIDRSLPNWVQARSMVYPDQVLREIILAEFENLERVAPWPGPKFVLTHIVAPHAPYLFDSQGEPVPSDSPFTLVEPGATTGRGGNSELYRDQAIFITGKTQVAIDAILQNSPTPPIILLQSDHGSGAGQPWQGMSEPGLSQRASILNAYLLPESCRAKLYPTITPVNSFRVVFNCALGASLSLLPDRTYYTPDLRLHDYSFEPVEGLVK